MAKITQSMRLVVSLLAIYLSVATASGRSLLQDRCSYTIEVVTGDVQSAGTPSKISLTLTGDGGQSFSLDNLEDWGDIPGHNYFERGQVDRFQGDATCIGLVCEITVTSDGKGSRPGWYLSNVRVSNSNGGPVATFIVEEWLQSGHLSVTKSLC